MCFVHKVIFVERCGCRSLVEVWCRSLVEVLVEVWSMFYQNYTNQCLYNLI